MCKVVIVKGMEVDPTLKALYDSLDNMSYTDSSGATTHVKHDGKGGLQMQFTADVTNHIEAARAEKNIATTLNLKPDYDNDGLVKLYSIPSAITTLWWWRDGFHAGSPEKSKMSADEHYTELKRKVALECPVFNVSKYNRI